MVTDRQQARSCWRLERAAVLAVDPFLRDEERSAGPRNRLPRSWDVTGDSIAAWIAGRWPAEELVLVKSRDIPTGDSTGAVDAQFSRVAAGCGQVSWVNLRSESPAIQTWTSTVT